MTSKQIISIFGLAGLLASADLLSSQTQRTSLLLSFISTKESIRERQTVDETVQAVLKSMTRRSRPPIGREFPTSTPGVSYILLSNGDVEFQVPPGFRGVAVTPDDRNLYLAN
jgi:hypothetical protein